MCVITLAITCPWQNVTHAHSNMSIWAGESVGVRILLECDPGYKYSGQSSFILECTLSGFWEPHANVTCQRK